MDVLVMAPDPSRMWFVYVHNREMGPFMEDELRKKFNRRDLPVRAFVYTEGMDDWMFAIRIPVLIPRKLKTGTNESP